ncbi:Hypothetical_protein [Hexamita inflata]|uniref:Hypothetical_protein n=1 Tax=Hexamita inflata TaxID=28002 RepID=A0AA86QMJ8_9EUKA|nr:Hypothetical protein HINF_LOCUS44287 [Hexamita inflata]
MFKYTQIEDYLNIAPYCRSECQNNLGQFFSKSFAQVKIQGNYKNKILEFILQSYQTNIQSMIIENCVIDLKKASGDFINVSFTGCELINDFTDQFRAVSLTFKQTVKLSQLKNCYVQKVNISANQQCKIDFEGAKQIQKLNELAFCDKFDAKHQKHQKLFNQLQQKQIKLTLDNMKVDMQQLTGRFDELTLNQCVLLNSGTEKLSCQQLNVFDCKLPLISFSTNIFYKINCKSMKIQQCAVVDYLPLNLQELHVDNSEVKIKNKCQHLQKISLNYVNKIQQVDMSLLPNLLEITAQNSLKQDVTSTCKTLLKHVQSSKKCSKRTLKGLKSQRQNKTANTKIWTTSSSIVLMQFWTTYKGEQNEFNILV